MALSEARPPLTPVETPCLLASIARPTEGPMTWTALKPQHFPWFNYSRYSFSLGLVAGNRTFLSGHTASQFDPESRRMVIRGDMAEQTRTAYAKAAAILSAADQTLADAVRVIEYVSPRGIEHYDEAASVRAELFGDSPPTICTTPVKALLRPDAFIEVEVFAATDKTALPLGLPTGVGHEASDIVYLPSIEPVDAAGNIIGGNDLVAQTHAVYEQAAAVLEKVGLGTDSIVQTLDYITPGALDQYKHTGRVRKERLGPVYPAAAGIIVPRLVHPEALIRVEIIATRATPEAVNPGWARYEKLTYSPGVKSGNMLFLSGQAALDPETERMLFEGDVVAQAEYTYNNIIKVVEAAGGGAENLIKTIEYTTPAALANYREVANVRSQLLSQPFPVSTGPVCEALLRPEMLIEIDPYAILL